MTPDEALQEGLRSLGVVAGGGALEKLLRYTELLAKWNRTYNLTAISDPLGMVTHHLLDSLAVVPHLPLPAEAVIADVGSGGGLPGIPIAIVKAEWRVTVNDASEKKAAFLRQAAIELQLPNLSVHEGRVERWQPARRFALVISRAFAELGEFIERSCHLLEPSGWLAAMKGALSPAEIAAASKDWDCGRAIRLDVPFLAAERHLVLCRRVAA
jgi:16S rRNA (guanine527-N7)-methyltransferase